MDSYAESQDGLKCWLELCENYDQEGSKDILIRKYEAVVLLAYSYAYPGGLTICVEN